MEGRTGTELAKLENEDVMCFALLDDESKEEEELKPALSKGSEEKYIFIYFLFSESFVSVDDSSNGAGGGGVNQWGGRSFIVGGKGGEKRDATRG